MGPDEGPANHVMCKPWFENPVLFGKELTGIHRILHSSYTCTFLLLEMCVYVLHLYILYIPVSTKTYTVQKLKKIFVPPLQVVLISCSMNHEDHNYIVNKIQCVN